MKITIESTHKLVEIQTPTGKVMARIWEGHSERGIPIVCFVTRVQVNKAHDTREFEEDLQEHKPPSAVAEAVPLRFFID